MAKLYNDKDIITYLVSSIPFKQFWKNVQRLKLMGFSTTCKHFSQHFLPGRVRGLVDGIRGCSKVLGAFSSYIFGIHTQFAKLSAFWKILPQKHPICSKLGVFCSNLATVTKSYFSRYRDSRSSEVRLLWASPCKLFWRTPRDFLLSFSNYGAKLSFIILQQMKTLKTHCAI